MWCFTCVYEWILVCNDIKQKQRNNQLSWFEVTHDVGAMKCIARREPKTVAHFCARVIPSSACFFTSRKAVVMGTKPFLWKNSIFPFCVIYPLVLNMIPIFVWLWDDQTSQVILEGQFQESPSLLELLLQPSAHWLIESSNFNVVVAGGGICL